jgi:hypothetical protein
VVQEDLLGADLLVGEVGQQLPAVDGLLGVDRVLVEHPGQGVGLPVSGSVPAVARR